MKTEPIAATVVEVKGPDIRIVDSFTGKVADYGPCVVVEECESGVQHTFMNGSINGIDGKYAVVGTKGFIVWERSASFNLPFFTCNPDRI